MQTPSTAQIRTAIEVLKKFGEHLNHNAVNTVMRSQVLHCSRRKLIPLCPTPDKAPNIWPASIFAFLSTMAVFQAARRIAPNLSLGITAELLCDDFLRAMFSPRRQPEDYCRPKGFRYTSDEKFPPLANDLHFNFKLQLQPDLATVILALMIDKRLRDPLLYAVPLGKNQQLDLVCGSQFVAAADTREACRRIWRRFLFDPKRKAVDASFEKDFDELFLLRLEETTT